MMQFYFLKFGKRSFTQLNKPSFIKSQGSQNHIHVLETVLTLNNYKMTHICETLCLDCYKGHGAGKVIFQKVRCQKHCILKKDSWMLYFQKCLLFLSVFHKSRNFGSYSGIVFRHNLIEKVLNFFLPKLPTIVKKTNRNQNNSKNSPNSKVKLE